MNTEKYQPSHKGGARRKEGRVRLGRNPGARKSRLYECRLEIEALLLNGSMRNFIAARYGVTEPRLYNWLAKNSIDATPIVARTA
jgi:hypothetical protein